jgi:hypothetical protein
LLTSSSKQKGRLLQQWVRDKILQYNPSLQADDVKSTSMGASGEDVQLSPAARNQLPVSIECKSYANMVFYKWYEQCVNNCPKDCEPIVVAKANRKKPVVIIDAEYFFKQFPKRLRK